MNQEILKSIIDSNELPNYLQELYRFWEAEQKERHEFWASVSDDIKAEFIKGEVIYHSPVTKKHNQISLRILMPLSKFIDNNQLGFLGFEKVMCRFTRNDYEPDICFWSKEKSKEFTDNQTVFPVPDFIVEILSKSTEVRDRGVKFEDYTLHKVSEYWIIDPQSETLEQYFQEDGKFKLHAKLKEGDVTTQVIAGFIMSVEDIFA